MQVLNELAMEKDLAPDDYRARLLGCVNGATVICRLNESYLCQAVM